MLNNVSVILKMMQNGIPLDFRMRYIHDYYKIIKHLPFMILSRTNFKPTADKVHGC